MSDPHVSGRRVSVERVIDAPRQAIFDVLADPAMHPVIDGSGTVKRARGNPARLGMGSRFSMDMRIGLPYLIRNRVVEFEEGSRIAWRHFHGHRWRYELEDVDGGTLVRETFDWSTARFPRYIEMAGFPEKHPRSMARTLERLEQHVTG
ncbi:MAG: SRPBCC family protein [Actinomycetes bacterium]